MSRDGTACAGIPTVNARGPVLVNGRPALIYDRLAQGSKDVVRLRNKKIRIVGDSPLLNERSVSDLKRIRKIMIERNIRVNDLQFMIGEDGSIVASDPLGVSFDKGPSRKNLNMIRLLIEQAGKGGK